MTSSAHNRLCAHGYLSVSGFVEYLKEFAPHMSMSYPTALRMIKDGSIRAVRVGSIHRVQRDEIERFVTQGNYGSSKQLTLF